MIMKLYISEWLSTLLNTERVSLLYYQNKGGNIMEKFFEVASIVCDIASILVTIYYKNK